MIPSGSDDTVVTKRSPAPTVTPRCHGQLVTGATTHSVHSALFYTRCTMSGLRVGVRVRWFGSLVVGSWTCDAMVASSFQHGTTSEMK